MSVRNGYVGAIGLVVALIVGAGCGGSSSHDNSTGAGGSPESSIAAPSVTPSTTAPSVTVPVPTTARPATTPTTACPPGESTRVDFTFNPPKVVGCGPALPPPPATNAPAPATGVQAPVGPHDFGNDQFQTATQNGYVP